PWRRPERSIGNGKVQMSSRAPLTHGRETGNRTVPALSPCLKAGACAPKGSQHSLRPGRPFKRYHDGAPRAKPRNPFSLTLRGVPEIAVLLPRAQRHVEDSPRLKTRSACPARPACRTHVPHENGRRRPLRSSVRLLTSRSGWARRVRLRETR